MDPTWEPGSYCKNYLDGQDGCWGASKMFQICIHYTVMHARPRPSGPSECHFSFPQRRPSTSAERAVTKMTFRWSWGIRNLACTAKVAINCSAFFSDRIKPLGHIAGPFSKESYALIKFRQHFIFASYFKVPQLLKQCNFTNLRQIPGVPKKVYFFER